MNKIVQINIGDKFGTPWGKGGLGLGAFASIILSNAMVAASIILLLLLLFGGISIIMGAGSGNPDQTARGKKAASSALVGYLIIFTAYWIIQIVEKISGINILNPGI